MEEILGDSVELLWERRILLFIPVCYFIVSRSQDFATFLVQIVQESIGALIVFYFESLM